MNLQVPKTPFTIFVMGYGEHGKGEVGDRLSRYLGVPALDSSMFACEKVIYPILKDKYGYTSAQQCYDDRRNHRDEWYQGIKKYNTPDLTRLTRKLFHQAPIYIGIRDDQEYLTARAQGLGDLSIWVDDADRKPPESAASCKVTKEMADIILLNNQGLEELDAKIRSLCRVLNR